MTRRTSRLVLALTLGAAGPLWLAPPALAATTPVPGASGGYFFSGGVPDTGTNAGKPANVTAMADGVSAGNLGVAGQGTQEDKVSFLGFDLSELAEGTVITKAVLSVPLVKPDPPRDVFLNANVEMVRACAAGDEGFGGEDGESLTVAPARLCDDFEAPATASADGGRYEFDVTDLAGRILDGESDGVALTRAAEAGSFQVVFAPAEQALLTLTTEAGEVVEEVGNTGADLGPIDTPTGTADDGGSGTTDLAGGFDSGSFDTPADSGAGVEVAIAEAPPLSAGELPAEETVELVQEEAPAVADDQQVAVTNVAAGQEAPLTPTPAFWFAGLVLAGLLALLGLILGDPNATPRSAAGAAQSRLDRALQQGRQGLSG